MGSVFIAAVFIALQFSTGLANPDSKRLYDDLLSNYNRLIRPVGNNSDRLTVKMGLRLSQLIDVVSVLFSCQNILYILEYLHTFTIYYKSQVFFPFRIEENVKKALDIHSSTIIHEMHCLINHMKYMII